MYYVRTFGMIAPALLWAALITSVYSGIEYFGRYMPHLVKLWRADQEQMAGNGR